jgi:hypothetical protein
MLKSLRSTDATQSRPYLITAPVSHPLLFDSVFSDLNSECIEDRKWRVP